MGWTSWFRRKRRKRSSRQVVVTTTHISNPIPRRRARRVAGAWLNQVVRTFAPIVCFHANETQFPSSVDEFVAFSAGRSPLTAIALGAREVFQRGGELPPVYILLWPGVHNVSPGTSVVVANRGGGHEHPNPVMDADWCVSGDFVLAYNVLFPFNCTNGVLGDVHVIQVHFRGWMPWGVVVVRRPPSPESSDSTTLECRTWDDLTHTKGLVRVNNSRHNRTRGLRADDTPPRTHPVVYSELKTHNMYLFRTDTSSYLQGLWETVRSRLVVLEPDAWMNPGTTEWWLCELDGFKDTPPFSCAQ